MTLKNFGCGGLLLQRLRQSGRAALPRTAARSRSRSPPGRRRSDQFDLFLGEGSTRTRNRICHRRLASRSSGTPSVARKPQSAVRSHRVYSGSARHQRYGRSPVDDRATKDRATARRRERSTRKFRAIPGSSRSPRHHGTVEHLEYRPRRVCVAEAARRLDQRIEHRLQVER